MTCLLSIEDAQICVEQGGVIAYPTEAVYGLGCDPWNEKAVRRILALKKRAEAKGMIVLIHDWEQLMPWVLPFSEHVKMQLEATWPGPVSWVFPKSHKVPAYISGLHDTIVLRMTAHPVAHALCKFRPLVSTSANVSDEPPLRSLDALMAQFPTGLDGIVMGDLGGALTPTTIQEIGTAKKLRE